MKRQQQQEAATMMYGLRSRDQQKKGTNVLFVDESIFPQNLAVIQTRVIPQGMKIQVGNYKELEFTPEIFACIIQYPNASGSVEDYREFVEKAHAANCKVAVDADILSLALLLPPGEWGADIVFGSTQRLGIPLFYGGPSAAYFATRDEYKRNMPGRIIGLSKTNMAKSATAWLYRPENSISNVKKQLPTSVPHRHCSLQWQASMLCITAKKESRTLPNVSTARHLAEQSLGSSGICAAQRNILRHLAFQPSRPRIGTKAPHNCIE